MKQTRHVGQSLGQGKKDYGDGGLIYALFSAPKNKFSIAKKKT